MMMSISMIMRGSGGPAQSRLNRRCFLLTEVIRQTRNFESLTGTLTLIDAIDPVCPQATARLYWKVQVFSASSFLHVARQSGRQVSLYLGASSTVQYVGSGTARCLAETCDTIERYIKERNGLSTTRLQRIGYAPNLFLFLREVGRLPQTASYDCLGE